MATQGARRQKSKRAPLADPAPSIAPPRGLRVYRFEEGGEELALFELAIGEPAGGTAFDALTRAEEGVARLVLRGLSNAEIARRRGTSPHTVANQLASIFRKLHIASRSELYALGSRAR
jgi:DNA-binding CsgD family transcriptional regulator